MAAATGDTIALSVLAQSDLSVCAYGFDLSARTCKPVFIRAHEIGYLDCLRLLLDDGSEILCTADQYFVARDGTQIAAEKLKQGQSMMPLYTHLDPWGYELLYVVASREYEYTHRLFAPPPVSEVVHHRDYNARNNHPANLVWMTWDAHRALHRCSEETRIKKSSIAKRNWDDPAFRARVLAQRAVTAAKRKAAGKSVRSWVLSVTPDKLKERAEKIRQSKLGKPRSAAVKAHLSAVRKGKATVAFHSAETKAKMSLARKHYYERIRAEQAANAGDCNKNNHKLVAIESAGKRLCYSVVSDSPFSIGGIFAMSCNNNI